MNVSETSQPTPTRGRRLRVLFVEDSALDTELVCTELRRGGFDVEFTRVDTEAALIAALRDGTWDLVISDFSMPGFDGLRAFDVFRQTGIDIPFIFVSGAMGEERAVQAMRAGARDYLLKGQLGRLNAAVQRELHEAESRRLRREMEAEKLREQSRLAVALQATGAGVFEYSLRSGQPGYCNERFAEIFGVRREDLPPENEFGRWFGERLHPEDRQRTVSEHRDFIAGRTDHLAFECRVRHADGTWRDVSCAANALSRDEKGRAVDVVGVLLDRTSEKRLEQQFRHAQKMEAIGRLAGGIAHDFNNLLTVISNFGEFVLERLMPGSEVHGDMQEVLKAAARAEELTSQLLAYSRHRPVAPVVLNLNDSIGEMDRMMRRLLGESVDLRTRLADDLWCVRMDPSGFEQVLMNLAVNARDAMPAGGQLCIATRNRQVDRDYITRSGFGVPAGQYVELTVTDSGHGMDAGTQARLFEPFFTTKEAGKGTGLGLATCYGIVKQAGGYIWAESEPGSGCSFYVLLPGEAATEDPSTEPVPPHSLRGSETLLVVEDDEAVRKLVVRLLKSYGYDVLEAADAAGAIQVAAAIGRRIHAVLTDVVMPGTQGPELARQLAERQPDIRPIYMSGYTRGAIDTSDTAILIQKPFAPDDLARKVRAVLDREEPIAVERSGAGGQEKSP